MPRPSNNPSLQRGLKILGMMTLVAMALIPPAIWYAYGEYRELQEYRTAESQTNNAIGSDGLPHCRQEQMVLGDKETFSTSRSGPRWFITLKGTPDQSETELVRDDNGFWHDRCALYDNVRIGDTLTVKLWRDQVIYVSFKGYSSETRDNPTVRCSGGWFIVFMPCMVTAVFGSMYLLGKYGVLGPRWTA